MTDDEITSKLNKLETRRGISFFVLIALICFATWVSSIKTEERIKGLQDRIVQLEKKLTK